MNALERNRYTESWRAWGAALPRPRAVLVISAHWFIHATAVTAMAQPRTIHDFYGFPPELFALDYPAPGDPALAEEVADVVRPVWVGQDEDSWGLDHGTWSVLTHVLPDADVPVVQLSINAQKPFEYHLDLGARLAPLRRRGVLVVGSGNVVHNLRRVDATRAETGFDWAHRFNEAVQASMLDSPGDVLTVAGHQDFDAAVPTPDHFIPLLYLAGIAAADGQGTELLVDGYTYGSLSMAAYVAGSAATPLPVEEQGGSTSSLPDPDVVPPDETNT